MSDHMNRRDFGKSIALAACWEAIPARLLADQHIQWQRQSSSTGALPVPSTSREQTGVALGRLDKDSPATDFVLSFRVVGPAWSGTGACLIKPGIATSSKKASCPLRREEFASMSTATATRMSSLGPTGKGTNYGGGKTPIPTSILLCPGSATSLKTVAQTNTTI